MRKAPFFFIPLLFVSHIFALPMYEPVALKKTLVQITFKDPDDGGNTVLESAFFENQRIRLRPRSPNGVRSILHKKLSPGTYKVEWTVETDLRTLSERVPRRETFLVRPEDVWINILIEGKEFILL
ncbi:MAG: hypothetical protein AAGI90_02175 [Chlamydiota bacterium]